MIVNIPPISSSRLSIASGVITPAILMTVSFCAARISYVPFLVLLDILALLVLLLALLVGDKCVDLS
jgi:hypothetical protein